MLIINSSPCAFKQDLQLSEICYFLSSGLTKPNQVKGPLEKTLFSHALSGLISLADDYFEECRACCSSAQLFSPTRLLATGLGDEARLSPLCPGAAAFQAGSREGAPESAHSRWSSSTEGPAAPESTTGSSGQRQRESGSDSTRVCNSQCMQPPSDLFFFLAC